MCCCIPLRRLSYFGTAMHMLLGLFYMYCLGCVAYILWRKKDKERETYEERFTLGLLYIGYYAAFLPPGIFIFWGVHKKLRCYLAVPSLIFSTVQIYGLALGMIFKFQPHDVPDALEELGNNIAKLNALKADYWMDICTQVVATLLYQSMLYFYYREIGPEPEPVQSRYAQAYHQQLVQYPLQQGLHHSLPLPLPPPQGPPPLPFRPMSQASNPPSSLPPLLPPFTYEQQQQLMKLQQHPALQQMGMLQHPQHPQHQPSYHHSHHNLHNLHQQHNAKF